MSTSQRSATSFGEAAADAPADALVLVEGQGSLCHPGSTATLPLLRGSQPTDLLLVHRAGQTTIRHHPAISLPPLGDLIASLEALAALGRPAGGGEADRLPRVVAIALNTAHLEEKEAALAITSVAEATGLPCDDPVRHGGRALLEALGGPDLGHQGRSTVTEAQGLRASEGIRTPE